MNDKYKIFGKGTDSCLITPQLPCKNYKNKNKKNKGKKITKLFLTDEINEYKINNLIKKRIKNYSKWSVLWDDLCISENYDKLKKYNIQDCFDENIHKSYFYLLQGKYSGISLDKYINQTITRDILINKNKFIKNFKEIFKLLKNVFLGLTELYKNDICHQDIASKNILVKNNKTYIIDYGLSIELNENIDDKSDKINRMKDEYEIKRIYETYPMEYFYYPVKDKRNILNEIKNLHNIGDIFNFNQFYKPINDLFNIDIYNNIYNLLEEKLRNENYQDIKGILKKLDTYSLASMIIILYIDICDDLNIDNSIVFNHMKDPKLKEYMDLLKVMLTFEHKDRPSMPQVYKKYLNLIQINKKKKTRKKKNA